MCSGAGAYLGEVGIAVGIVLVVVGTSCVRLANGDDTNRRANNGIKWSQSLGCALSIDYARPGTAQAGRRKVRRLGQMSPQLDRVHSQGESRL